MRIAVDVSPAVHRRAGIGRYAGELTRALQSLNSPHKFVAVFNRAAEAALEEIPAGMERMASPDYDKPLRLKIRTGSFTGLGCFEEVTRGLLIGDVIAVIGSFDIVLPEVDR